MLKPARIVKVTCLVEKTKTQTLVEALHKAGHTQLEQLTDEKLKEEGIRRDQSMPHTQQVSEQLHTVKSLIESLKNYQKTQTTFLDEILGVEKNPKAKQKTDEEYENLLSELKKQTTQQEDTIHQHTLSKERIHARINELKPVSQLEILAEYFTPTPLLQSLLGIIPHDQIAPLTQELDQKLNQQYLLTVEAEHGDKTVVTAHVQKQHAQELAKTLRNYGLEQINPEGAGTTKQIHDRLMQEYLACDKPITDAQTKLAQLSQQHLTDLMCLSEKLSNEQERAQATTNFGATTKTNYIRLWILEKDLQKTTELINQKTGGICEITAEKDPKDAPIILDNHPLLKPFETFTRLFSTPKYDQIDPTIVTAPTFIIFFGFMVGDAAYGLAITVIAMLLRRKYLTHKKITDFTTILTACGMSTIVFGILTGSFFGDFLTKYVLDVKAQDLWFVLIDPLYKSNAVLLLGVAVAVGVLQTLLGNILGIIDKLQRRELKKALTENVCWLLIGAGVAVAAAYNITYGAILFTLGFALLFKGMGFMAIMELPGVLGKVVSYARLLALSLTTPGMGLAFNFLASMVFGIPIIGKIGGVLIFILSHTIILLMNSLGSFVHALRLHYVEFYGTFYNGGGAEFKPFSEKTKFTTRR